MANVAGRSAAGHEGSAGNASTSKGGQPNAAGHANSSAGGQPNVAASGDASVVASGGSLVAARTDAGEPSTEAGKPGDGGTALSFCLAGSGDFSETGPYAVATTDVDLGSDGRHTIFHPEPFDPNCRHPFVVWGNGSGVSGAEPYAFYQEHAASWGVIVMASHLATFGEEDDLVVGIDYLMEANADPSSKFFRRLGPRVGTAGQAQGGFYASFATTHASTAATVCLGGCSETPEHVALLCLTGTNDLRLSVCKRAYESAPGRAFLANYDGADNIIAQTLSGFEAGNPATLQYRRLYTAWFRCFLADDPEACSLFSGGSDCGICGDPGWAELRSRNF